MSVEIPEVFSVEDPEQLRQFCVAVKMFCDELARKAQSLQLELRSDAPIAGDIDEGELVRATNNNIYTKIGGLVRTISTS